MADRVATIKNHDMSESRKKMLTHSDVATGYCEYHTRAGRASV